MNEIDYELRKLNVEKILEDSAMTDDEWSAYQLISVIVYLNSTIQQVVKNQNYTVQNLLADLYEISNALTASLGAMDEGVAERGAEVYSKCHGAMVD